MNSTFIAVQDLNESWSIYQKRPDDTYTFYDIINFAIKTEVMIQIIMNLGKIEGVNYTFTFRFLNKERTIAKAKFNSKANIENLIKIIKDCN